jgi:hypothetical protein
MISKSTLLLNPPIAMQTLLILAVLSFVGATSRGLFYNATQTSQLAHFVANIATQSFSPDKILLVSSNEYDETVDMMLKCVHQYALWQLHVSIPGDSGLKEMKEQDDKVGSYVMFTTGAEDALSQAVGLKESMSWNNRALFLIVVRNPTTTPERLAFSVVENLWQNVWVFNIVILVATDTTIHLYTWFPYGQHKQCGEVREIVPINVLSEADDRNITTDIKLFSYQAPSDFWGCPVTVALIYENHTAENLISDFLPRLNFSVTYKHLLNKSSEYVQRLGMTVDDFLSGKTHIITSIILQKYLLHFGDISHAVEWYENLWYVPCPTPIDRIQKIATIFSLTLCIAMTAVLIVTGITIWQLARLSGQDDTYKDISTVLYNAWAVVVCVGVTKMPRSYHLRIVILSWIWYCFSVSTVSQTFLTTFLVDPGLQKQIVNLHELSESRMDYGVPTGKSRMYDIQDALTDLTDTKHECDDSAKCVERIIETGNFALFVESRSVNSYLASTKKRNKVCVMNYYDVDHQRMVNLFSTGTQILEQFNKFVTRMQESGEITKHERNVRFYSSTFHDEEDASQQYFVFSISHLLVAFYALSIGHSLGFVMFLLELLHH